MPEMQPNFGAVAETYARVRPGYPPQVFDDLVALTDIPQHGRILEIGPATGQATLPLALRGYDITGVELEESLVREARRLLADYANVELHVADFEAWPLSATPSDMVLAATAFHWIDPAIRYVKSAQALRSGGALAVIHSRHVAGGDQAFFDQAQAFYQAHMPGAGARPLPRAEELPPGTAGVRASGLFDEPEVRRYLWHETYTARQYTDLLSTYSDHIALPEESRRALFECIAALIDGRHGGSMRKQYLTELVVARKR